MKPHQQVRNHQSPYCFAEILSDPTVTSRLSDTKVILYSAFFFFLSLVFQINQLLYFPSKFNFTIFVLNFQAAGEVKALEDFYKMLQHEPDRALYG